MSAWDVVIRGGTVYDGTGAAGVRADVAVRGDRIAAIGTVAGPGSTEIDAADMAVTPGFIDVHTHDDFAVLLEPEMPFKVMQGVTTAVVGNCGSGVVPYEAGLVRFRRMHPGAEPPRWDGFGGYLERVDEIGPSLNVAVLMGHGSLRRGAMDLAERPPRADELDRMKAWVREGVAAGAVGLSTGLIYEPGRYAKTEEIVALARAQPGGLVPVQTCGFRQRPQHRPLGSQQLAGHDLTGYAAARQLTRERTQQRESFQETETGFDQPVRCGCHARRQRRKGGYGPARPDGSRPERGRVPAREGIERRHVRGCDRIGTQPVREHENYAAQGASPTGSPCCAAAYCSTLAIFALSSVPSTNAIMARNFTASSASLLPARAEASAVGETAAIASRAKGRPWPKI